MYTYKLLDRCGDVLHTEDEETHETQTLRALDWFRLEGLPYEGEYAVLEDPYFEVDLPLLYRVEKAGTSMRFIGLTAEEHFALFPFYYKIRHLYPDD